MSAPDFLESYQQCLNAGKLESDPAQQHVSEHLELLSKALLTATQANIIQKIFAPRAAAKNLRGVYLWGDVGRGKSMLMDMFFKAAPLKAKKRMHFYSLMLMVHQNIHFARQKNIDDPVKHVAKELAKKIKLLCLDELQVTDVADAMILSKLFTTFFDENVVVFITSNRPPDELYQGGLQREKFMDFVALVRERMDILELASPKDYRTQKIKSLDSVYLTPLDSKNDALLQKIFSDVTNHVQPEEVTLEIQGRQLEVREAVGKTAKFTFEELCEKPLGAADYLAICQRFDTVFVSGIPMMTAEKRNEARRFVILIDNLYDNHIKLICTAAVTPQEIYPKGDGSFEFHRTVSRLMEMQSESYLSA